MKTDEMSEHAATKEELALVCDVIDVMLSAPSFASTILLLSPSGRDVLERYAACRVSGEVGP